MDTCTNYFIGIGGSFLSLCNNGMWKPIVFHESKSKDFGRSKYA